MPQSYRQGTCYKLPNSSPSSSHLCLGLATSRSLQSLHMLLHRQLFVLSCQMWSTYGQFSCFCTMLHAVNPSTSREITVDACCAVPHPHPSCKALALVPPYTLAHTPQPVVSCRSRSSAILETLNIYMHTEAPPHERGYRGSFEDFLLCSLASQR